MAAVTSAVVGGISAVASVSEARKGRKAAGRAAGLQADAAREAAALEAERFAETKETLDPFITGGTSASQLQEALSGALGPEAQAQAFQDFQESPGTGFLREQGLRLINSGAGATGGLGGGNRLRELTKFSQGLALQDLNQQFGRLGSVAGRGLSAATTLGGLGAGSTARRGGLVTDAGAAEASGVLGERQATAEGVEGVISAIPSIVGGLGSRPAPSVPDATRVFGADVGPPDIAQSAGFGIDVGQVTG